MGSSAKRRKEKAQDFAKAKLKLGKGKQKAANATDTSFSSKTVALSQQNIGRDHKDVPTTRRNLSLDDLLLQLKHYNASTRKDALAGLKELLIAHDDLAIAAVNRVVPLAARLIGDEDSSVRKALLSFFSWYLPFLPQILLQPYHATLIIFTTSAISHIYPDIRLDAVKVLDLLIDTCSSSLQLGWSLSLANAGQHGSDGHADHAQSVLESYMALLHIRSGSTSNGLRTDMSPASKALILSSLAKFLKASLAAPAAGGREARMEQAAPDIPTWFLSSSFRTDRDLASFLSSTSSVISTKSRSDSSPTATATPMYLMMDRIASHSADLRSLNSLGSDLALTSTVDGADGLPRSSAALLATLSPILLSAFLDSAPTAFSPTSLSAAGSSSSTELALRTVLAVVEIARDLWQNIVSSTSTKSGDTSPDIAALSRIVEKLASHVGPYFPFGGDDPDNRSTSNELQRLNVAYCEIVSLLALRTLDQAQAHQVKTTSRSNGKQITDTRLASQMMTVRRYIGSLLDPKDSVLRRPMTAHSFVELLPTIWCLLTAEYSVPSEDSALPSALRTLLSHFAMLSGSSGVKRVSLRFIVLILQAQAHRSYTGRFRLPTAADTDESSILVEIDQWTLSLPKYLWELGSSSPETSRVILEYLTYLIKSQSCSTATQERLMQFLVPFFGTAHASKGFVKGPWMRLKDLQLQKAALQMAWWFGASGSSEASQALVSSVSEVVRLLANRELTNYWDALISTSIL